MKNKRGQAESVIIFFGIVVAIFIASIIILRLTNSILTPFANQIEPYSNQSATVVRSIDTSFAGIWDWVVILLFLFNLVLLLVSAFLVDIHPAFLIVYIIAVVFLVIFGNSFAYIIDKVWEGVGTPVETLQTPMQQFIINNFNMIMLGVIALSGIVMYGKFRFFGGQGTGGNY
jgi:hypothetical protein